MPPRIGHESGFQVFRVLFPSWRFFDRLGDVAELYSRYAPADVELGGWKPCLAGPPRTVQSLFLNPSGNYFLAGHTLVERLLQDLSEWNESDLDAFSESVSFKLVTNLVRYEITRNAGGMCAAPFRFQFKIALLDLKQSTAPLRDVLVSPIFTEEC